MHHVPPTWCARAGAAISDAEIEAFYTRGEKPVGVLRVLRALDAELIPQPPTTCTA